MHIPPALEDSPLAYWFVPPKPGVFNEDFPPNFFETEVEHVAPEHARAIVLPNNFTKVGEKEKNYIAQFADLGEKLGVPVFVFCLGDFTDSIHFDPRVRVLTYSVYRTTLEANKIVMPTLTEDSAKAGIVVRQKQEVPVVSFCGQGGYKTHKQYVAYYIKVTLGIVAGFFKPVAKAHIVGVYWRKRLMKACESSRLVKTLFIVRKSFSGAHRTIELDPKQARQEYLDSIVEADFVLAPKGDGNYSNRFLKTLCMGRIPVLVDTDVVLPFEDRIDYEKIMVRIPMNDVANAPKYIRAFYDALSEEEWQKRQQLARETFENYLRQESFFRYFFTNAL
jgi:hypothetical protein